MLAEDDYLLLSGIQHFYFCKRQWALIHLEQQWEENEHTALGNILHEKADKPYIKEKRKGTFLSRAMPVSSARLGLTGILDVVEFHQSSSGIPIKNKKGLWEARVVEYKKGKNKKDHRDIVQLVAQVMALEENLKVSMDRAYLYYFETKEKQTVDITEKLRSEVLELSKQMHKLYRRGQVPKAEFHKNCQLCSLVDLCLPRTTKKRKSLENYLYGD